MQEKMTVDVMSSRVDRFVCISSPEVVCANEPYGVFYGEEEIQLPVWAWKFS
jgi:hypothetical protein